MHVAAYARTFRAHIAWPASYAFGVALLAIVGCDDPRTPAANPPPVSPPSAQQDARAAQAATPASDHVPSASADGGSGLSLEGGAGLVPEGSAVSETSAVLAAPEEPPSGTTRSSLPQTSAAELKLLTRARRLLRSAPAKALALTVDHQRAFKHPRQAERREVIAIEALVRLQRAVEARARARSFFLAFPQSSEAARVRMLLDHSE